MAISNYPLDIAFMLTLYSIVLWFSLYANIYAIFLQLT